MYNSGHGDSSHKQRTLTPEDKIMAYMKIVKSVKMIKNNINCTVQGVVADVDAAVAELTALGWRVVL